MSVEREMLAWAAGFFEGEGSIGIVSGSRWRISLHVTNTDLERLELFREIVGGGAIATRSPIPGRKLVYQWQAYSETAIRIFNDLSPWLGERRRTRFAEAAERRAVYIAEATASRLCPGCGESFSPRWNGQAKKVTWCSSRCRERIKRRRQRAKARA